MVYKMISMIDLDYMQSIKQFVDGSFTTYHFSRLLVRFEALTDDPLSVG
jgi:hypothetical protein